MAAMECSAVKLPIMDIQCNWDEVLRNSREKKFWVSYRKPGEVTENGHLMKSATGRVRGEEDGAFIVKDQSPWSLTVMHSKADLTTTFVRPRRHLQLHDKQLLSVDVSESGGLGVCSAEDGKMWVWEADTGEARRHLEGHVGDIYSCCFFPSGVVVLSGGADLRLKIWSVQDGSCARTLTGHTRGITDTAIIDQGRNIISVSKDGTAKLWDCGSAKCLATLMTTECGINACSIASDSSLLEKNTIPPKDPECGTNDKVLLLACEDGSLRCCDVRNRNNIMSLSEGQSPLSTCAFLSPTQVLSGAEDGTLWTTDLRKFKSALSKYQFCQSPVRAIQPLGENRCIAGFRDGSCIVWNANSVGLNQESFEVTKLTGPENDSIPSIKKSSGYVYTGCRDGTVRVYSIADL